MIHLTHVRDAGGATEWLRVHRERLQAEGVPVLFFCLTEGHGALRGACVKADYRGGSFFVDASVPLPTDRPAAVSADLVVVPDAAQVREALPFIERARQARRRLDVVWVESTPDPSWEWLLPEVDGHAHLA